MTIFSKLRQSGLICLLLPLSFFGFSQKIPVNAAPVSVTATYPVAPLLKGLDQNPVLCVRIALPAEKSSLNFKKVLFTLNTAAQTDIETLSIFFGGDEPAFVPELALTSIKPTTGTQAVNIDLSAKSGLNYLWVSARLKASASVSRKIQMAALALVDDHDKIYPVTQNTTSPDKYVGTAVRRINDDGVHTYRIPGIVTTNTGAMIAVYDIRYVNDRDLPGNIDVGMSRSTDGGNSWAPMKVVMDMGAPHENNGCGDPTVLFDPVTKRIWVAALWSKGNRSIAGSKPGLSPDTTGQFVLVHSDDDGLSWSAPESITPQVKNPAWHLYFNGPGNGIAMKDGTLVFPSQYWDENRIPHSAIVYSTNHGQSWQSGIGAKSKTTESQVVESSPGTLMLNMRNDRGNFRMVATTTNLGKNWTEHPSSYSALQEPVCMASFIKATVLVKGVPREVLFFCNPNTVNGRYNLTIKASLDMGETWLPQHQLLIDERKGYGYSALTAINNTTLGLLYEGQRELYFLSIPVKDIIK